MDDSRPKEARKAPRSNESETDTGQPDTHQHEYGDANPFQAPGEKTVEPRPGAPEREAPDDRVEREQER